MPNSKNWYIDKGFSDKMATYFASGRKKIIKVTPNRNFSISLVFSDNEKKVYNMLPLIEKGTVSEKLSDWNIFKKVYIDTDGNVCWNKDPTVNSEKDWNNKIDISADLLYVDSILNKNI